MKKIGIILGLFIFSVSAQGQMKCGDLLGRLTYEDFLVQAEQEEELRELYQERNDLRVALGPLKNQITSHIYRSVQIMEIGMLSGDYSSVFPFIDPVALATEKSFLIVSEARMELKRRSLGEDPLNDKSQADLEAEIKIHQEVLLRNFDEYEAYFGLLYDKMQSSNEDVARTARIVFHKAGFFNNAPGLGGTRDFLDAKFGGRPPLELIRAEVRSLRYDDGEPRALAFWSNKKDVQIEIEELRKVRRNTRYSLYLGLIGNVNTVANWFIEKQSPFLKFIGKTLKALSYDIRNFESIKIHINDIQNIRETDVSQKVTKFKEIWGTYAGMNRGLDFLVSFARSTFYSKEWTTIYRLMALESAGRHDLIKKYEDHYRKDNLDLEESVEFFQEVEEIVEAQVKRGLEPEETDLSTIRDFKQLVLAVQERERLGLITFNEQASLIRGKIIFYGGALFSAAYLGLHYLNGQGGGMIPPQAVEALEQLLSLITGS